MGHLSSAHSQARPPPGSVLVEQPLHSGRTHLNVVSIPADDCSPDRLDTVSLSLMNFTSRHSSIWMSAVSWTPRSMANRGSIDETPQSKARSPSARLRLGSGGFGFSCSAASQPPWLGRFRSRSRPGTLEPDSLTPTIAGFGDDAVVVERGSGRDGDHGTESDHQRCQSHSHVSTLPHPNGTSGISSAEGHLIAPPVRHAPWMLYQPTSSCAVRRAPDLPSVRCACPIRRLR
jgi:hypothetical protein